MVTVACICIARPQARKQGKRWKISALTFIVYKSLSDMSPPARTSCGCRQGRVCRARWTSCLTARSRWSQTSTSQSLGFCGEAVAWLCYVCEPGWRNRGIMLDYRGRRYSHYARLICAYSFPRSRAIVTGLQVCRLSHQSKRATARLRM